MKLGNYDQSDVARSGSESMLPDPLPIEPFGLFREWFDLAQKRKDQPNPNAMTLATVGADGRPDARIVLCKGIDDANGHIVFYTNERGRKGRELAAHPHGAVVFHWDHMDRQVRIEGPVARSPAWESDAYFASRPLLSRIGAWASDQSEPIASRGAMVEKLHAMMRRFGVDPEHLPEAGARVDVPRPAHWGGFRVYAARVEMWCAGAGRVHDRAAWVRELRSGTGAEGAAFVGAGGWKVTRLQP